MAVGPARTVGFTLQGLFNPVVWTQPQKVQGHPHPSFLSCMQRSHIVFSINSSNSTLKRVRFFLTSVFLMAGSFFLGKKERKGEREEEWKKGQFASNLFRQKSFCWCFSLIYLHRGIKISPHLCCVQLNTGVWKWSGACQKTECTTHLFQATKSLSCCVLKK